MLRFSGRRLCGADGGNFDVVVLAIEEHAKVAAAETQTSERGLQLFYITDTTSQEATQAVENLQGLIAIDGAEIGAGFRRPEDPHALRGRRFRHLLKPNSRSVSSWGMAS